MSTYKPTRLSYHYYRLSRVERAEIARKVDQLFVIQTGVTRLLNPTSLSDRKLRNTWLRIRDSVINDREIEEEMDFRREDFMDDMPGIVAEDMKTQGWYQGAELLETWFERSPAIAPRYSTPVNNVIEMQWVLKFAEAKAVFDKILKDKIWTNPASQKRMSEICRKNQTAVGHNYCDLTASVTEVDKNWVNARPVYSKQWAPTAALGAFEFQVAVSGKVLWKLAGKFGLNIDEVGIYVKDSFDFNGSQFLGFWGHRDSPVNNIDFREWRSKNHAGGDFRVYSDIKRVKLSSPDTFTV